MVSISGSTISSNSAVNGGGIALDSVTASQSATVANIALSTIGNNTASGQGGGIFVDFTNSSFSYALALTHVTVASNTAAASGGGGLFVQSGSATLLDTLLANNTGHNAAAGSAANAFSSLGYNLGDDSSTPFLTATGDKNDTPAKLSTTLQSSAGQTATFVPLALSPAIGGGDNTGPALDQVGLPWLKPFSDIGAF